MCWIRREISKTGWHPEIIITNTMQNYSWSFVVSGSFSRFLFFPNTEYMCCGIGFQDCHEILLNVHRDGCVFLCCLHVWAQEYSLLLKLGSWWTLIIAPYVGGQLKFVFNTFTLREEISQMPYLYIRYTLFNFLKGIWDHDCKIFAFTPLLCLFFFSRGNVWQSSIKD